VRSQFSDLRQASVGFQERRPGVGIQPGSDPKAMQVTNRGTSAFEQLFF
jgi:hypothetical protein